MSHDGAMVDGVGVWNRGPMRYLEVEGFENEFVFFSGGSASAFNHVIDALGEIVFATPHRDDWFIIMAGWLGGRSSISVMKGMSWEGMGTCGRRREW